jgi:cytochrome c oxidase subunit II
MEETTGAPPRGGGRRTVTQMIVVGLIASAAGIAFGLAIDWFPAQGSTQAEKIDDLWDVLVIASVPFFVIVCVVVLFAVRDFRVRRGEEHLDGPNVHGSTRLEVIWTVLPALLLFGLCGYAYVVLEDIEEAPAAQERVIGVTGEQFTWTFTYDEGGKKFTTNRLYVPAGESVKFNVRSKDVIHDFWVPDWRMKIDAVPGLTTGFRVTPTALGDKAIVCAELCGLGHAYMRQRATVVPPAEFAAWVRNGGRTDQQVAATEEAGGGTTADVDGKTLFLEGTPTAQTGCGACHKLADAGSAGGVGPELDKVLAGQSVAEVTESIVDPQAKLTPGFEGIMPTNYGDVLSEAEVKTLAEYLVEVTK